MKIATINPAYRGSFFDDGGQAVWDKYYHHNDTVHAFDCGEKMIIPDWMESHILADAAVIDSYDYDTPPIIFEDYEPGGMHRTLKQIRKAER